MNDEHTVEFRVIGTRRGKRFLLVQEGKQEITCSILYGPHGALGERFVCLRGGKEVTWGSIHPNPHAFGAGSFLTFRSDPNRSWNDLDWERYPCETHAEVAHRGSRILFKPAERHGWVPIQSFAEEYASALMGIRGLFNTRPLYYQPEAAAA